MHPMSQFEAVAAGRHIHVGQKHIDLQSGFHQDQSLGAVGSLNNPEAGILKKLGQEKADQGLVFNQENCGMGGGHRRDDSWHNC